MPLVGASNSHDAVILEMKAQADQMIAEINRANKALDQQKQEVKKANVEAENSAAANKKASLSITDFRSAYQIAMDVVRAGQQVWQATTGAVIEYADQIRQLDQINGQSAESNSRLFQVLDDYKVTYADILTATKKLKDEGLVPNIDTIAKLAEQYQAIQDPAKKLEFAQKNLGKSTKDWLEILNQSPEILRKQAAGVSENLILSEKMIQEARLQEIAVDSLSDSWKGYMYQLGERGLPTTREFTDGLNVTIKAIEIGTSATYLATHRWGDFGDATKQATIEVAQSERDMLNAAAATDKLGASQQATTEETKALTDAYNGLISATFAIQGSMDSYQKSLDDAAAKDADLGEKKRELTEAFEKEQAKISETTAAYDAQHKGKKNLIDRENEHKDAINKVNDAYQTYMDKMNDLNKAQDENAQSVVKAKEELKKAADQRIFDLIKERLGADGVIDSGEFEYLEKIAVQKGLVSQAAADQAIAESQAADEAVNGYQSQASAGVSSANAIIKSYSAVNQTLSQTLGLSNAITTSFGGTVTTVPTTSIPTGGGGQHPNRDSGGYGMAGQTYMIGTGAQPELFTPSTNGNFTPANQQGSNKSVVINIGSVRNDQDIHFIAQEVERIMSEK